MIRVPEAFADRPGLVDETGVHTWGGLCAAASAVAQGLRDRYAPGSAVPFEAAATRDAIVQLLAIWEAGGVAVPLHPRWGDVERQDVFANAGTTPIESEAPLAALVRTSGSSGSPKLAALSHGALDAAAAASADRLGWDDADRWLLALPFAHVGGLSVIIRCLLAGRTIVLASDPLAALADGRCSIASVVPTQLARMVQRNMRPHPAVRLVLVGGAAASPDLVRRARALGWPVRLTYGLTETCAQFATQRPGDPDDTSGPPLSGYEARLREGVLEVRSPSLLSGFVVRGELRPALSDGWLRTGDVARLEGGLVRILGRADDAIVTGGEKVHPFEVESLLSQALDGADVCVVGVPDAEWGAVVGAVVVQRSMDEVQRGIQALRGRIAAHALPRRVVVTDALPLNPTGKVDRRAAAACFR